MQAANKTKSKFKKLLSSLDSSKQGLVQIDAFFQMLELHDIRLRSED